MRRSPPAALPALAAAALPALVAAAVTAAALLAPIPVRAQEPEDLDPPEMPDAPEQFRISLTGSALSWKSEAGQAEIDGGALVGVDVESRAGSWLAFRLGGTYGRTAATAAAPPEGEIPETTDVNQYIIDLSAVLRLGLPSLERAGVVPFALAGLGAVVHDPEFEELVTKSQSAALFGTGLDFDFADDFGARAEWRRYMVDAESLFDPTDRTGDDRHADRFMASLYWKL